MYRLENWVTRACDPYAPPELAQLYLVGDVYDHPGYEDGYHIRTSCVKSIDGNKITTETGSVYLLGEPDPEFVTFCEKIGCHVPTKENPLREIKKNDN